ncbi:MAG: hypothetical protein RLZ51_2575 [Pseudomonadota bacterium]
MSPSRRPPRASGPAKTNRPSSGGRAAQGSRASHGARPAQAAGLSLFEQICSALDEVLALRGPADMVLRQHFKAHPQLGRRDRGLIAETVFDVLRNRRLYAYWAQTLLGPLTRRLVQLSLARRHDPQALAGLGQGEHADMLGALVRTDTSALPITTQLSLPDWLLDRLRGSLDQAMGLTAPDDAALQALGKALLEPAPLDLRVNLLKTDRDAVLQALTAAGIEAQPVAEIDTAIRVKGKPAIERLAAFESGWFEVQDAGSQALVDFCDARRGQTVVDFCAGAGGKTLAMAAQMRNRGQIFACDTSHARLARMKPRLLRSGVTNIQPFVIEDENDGRLGRLAGRADRVLVDSPCSGTGTLRRNPEIKWRLVETDIAELAGKQLRILAAAARLVKPGGVLIYATCSLLCAENDEVAAAFAASHPGFEAQGVLRLLPGLTALPGVTAGPQGDGFFAARWLRRS